MVRLYMQGYHFIRTSKKYKNFGWRSAKLSYYCKCIEAQAVGMVTNRSLWIIQDLKVGNIGC